MSLHIMKPGLLTTVQDLGRNGHQKDGIIVSGAMDPFSLQCANLLVGNQRNEAALEMTLLGAKVRFETDVIISICGGDLSPSIDHVPAPMWKGLFVKKGSTLNFGRNKQGIRSYLAVAGGFSLPEPFHSRSTYLKAELGGYKGRALQAGDRIPLRNECIHMDGIDENDYPFVELTPKLSSYVRPIYSNHPTIRVLKGMQYDKFAEESINHFFNEPFTIDPQSDRMGYRLKGKTLKLKEKEEFISEAVTFGTIQVPADGNPIILMADRQTCGGYPKIAQIISVDLPVLAQLPIGTNILFQEVTIQEAQSLLLKMEGGIRRLESQLQHFYPTLTRAHKTGHSS